MREEAEESAYWSAQQAEADAKRWLMYERMIRVPARTLSELKRYKLDESQKRGMGRLPWMRTYKPLLAAILDEEIERLTVERDARRASRPAKRKGA